MLSPAKRRAVAALLSARDVQSAAEAAGISRRSLFRWLAEDSTFRAALAAAEGDAIDQAARRLIGLQDPAIGVITWAMADRNNPPGVRLRAAQAVLDYLLKLRELRNVEMRLSDLEDMVYGQNK